MPSTLRAESKGLGEESKEEGKEEEKSSAPSLDAPALYDNKKAVINVSLYLSLTALASLISSYFGAKLLDYMTV